MASIKTSSDPIVDTIRASLPETVNLDEDLEKDFASARENLTVVLSRRDKRERYMCGGCWQLLWSWAQWRVRCGYE